MKTRICKKGLTLIELMVAMLASAILMLIVATVLIMAFKSWRINNAYVDLRRNSAFAFYRMARDVRESSHDGLDDSTTGSLDIESEITGTTVTVTYSQSGDTLTRDGVLVIPQNVQFFTSDKDPDGTGNGDGVLLTLALADTGLGIALTNEVFVNTRN